MLLSAAAAALLSFIAYVATLAPGLLMNDSGEFQTLAVTLGHTHPTGYPVYLLLGKLATFLPIGEVAWRVNLLSALAAAVAAGGLAVVGCVLTGRVWLSLAAAVTLALSPTFWSQAIIAEVYAPAAAFTVAVLACLAGWQQSGRRGWLLAAGVLGGLSVGVHLTVALMAPPAVIFVLLGRNRLRNVSAAFGGGLIGLALMLAAFAIIDHHRPPSDYFAAVVHPSRSAWGLSDEDLDGFGDRLAFSLSARQYAGNLHRPSTAQLQRQAGDYLRNLPRELPPLWLAAASVGFVCLVRMNWRYALLLALTFASHLAYTVHHDMGDIHVGYIPTYLLLIVGATAALGAKLPPGVVAQPDASAENAPQAWAAHLEAIVVLVLVVAMLVPMFGTRAWTEEGRRSVWAPAGEPPFEVGYSEGLHREIRAVLNELEDDAVLFTEWGLLYPYYYVAHVEQGRTDLRFIQTYPAIGQDRLADSALKFVAAQSRVRRVYFCERLPEAAAAFHLEPVSRAGVRLFLVRERSVP